MQGNFVDEIKLPRTLNLPIEATFGVEIEFENAQFSDINDRLNGAKKNNLLTVDWQLKQDESLYINGHFKNFGGEVISPVLTDRINAYKQIRNACHIIKSAGGVITSKCGGHIHVGANLLNDDVKNYSRLARLWTVFEDEIIRFGLGTDEYPRDNMAFYAKSSAKLLRHIDLLEQEQFGKYDFQNFVRCYGIEKRMALSFFYLNKDKPFHTLEVRCPNGTLEPIIWKNNINFFVKLFDSCRKPKKDWSIVERLFQEEKNNDNFEKLVDCYNINKAYLLAKFVFDNEIEINNFMLQYKKDSDKVFVKSI